MIPGFYRTISFAKYDLFLRQCFARRLAHSKPASSLFPVFCVPRFCPALRDP